MKKNAQTTIEFIILIGLSIIAIFAVAAIFSENVRNVFKLSNYTRLMEKKDAEFENPNSNIKIETVEQAPIYKEESL